MCSKVKICKIIYDGLRWRLTHIPILFLVSIISIKQPKTYHNSGMENNINNYDFGGKMILCSCRGHY